MTEPHPQRDPSPLAGEAGRGPRRQARNFARRKALARVALFAAGAFIAACLAWPFAATVKRVVPPTPPADRP